MKMYYISGLPYSENELYHHGVPGMQWYRRRYQNSDGSLTPAGREHYRVGPPREKKPGLIRTYAGRAVKAIERNIKTRHPWMMSDEDIERFRSRVTAENSYLSDAQINRGYKERKSFTKDLVQREVTKFADKSVDELTNRMLDRGSMARQFVQDLSDKDFLNMSMGDLEKAAYKATYLRAIEGKGQLPKKDKDKGKGEGSDDKKEEKTEKPNITKNKLDTTPLDELKYNVSNQLDIDSKSGVQRVWMRAPNGTPYTMAVIDAQGNALNSRGEKLSKEGQDFIKKYLKDLEDEYDA